MASTGPADGSRVHGPLIEYAIDFNDLVLLTSLQAKDVTFDGIAATAVTIVDADTAIFTVPDLVVEGTITVAIAAGAISDIQGTPIDAFTATYYNDVTPPRVVASSIQEGQTDIPVGDLMYTVEFSEAMNPAGPIAFLVQGQYRNAVYFPTNIEWDASYTAVTITYFGLPDDAYTLTLLSWALQDTVGIALDGEPTAWPIPSNESGDGIEGGDFYVDFATDLDTQSLPTPLLAVQPPGSLIYQTPYNLDGTIAFTDDTDDFTIDVDGGQTLTILVQPGYSLQGTIEMHDSANSLVGGPVTGTFAGSEVILQTAPAATAGTYTITISGTGSLGYYSVGLTLNAALEDEAHGGLVNNDPASAQSIEASFIPLVGGAQRGAVRGVSGDDDVYAFELSAGQSLAAALAFDAPLAGVYGPRTDYAMELPWSVALGDVNGDSHLDMITSSGFSYSSVFSARLGLGDGSFGDCQQLR